MRAVTRYFKANPQVFLLFVICVVLGLGTFIAVLIAIGGSGGGTSSGEPADAISAFTALLSIR